MTPPASTDPPITANDLQGFKRLRKVADLLAHLHGVGCDRDKAHNRLLHFDDYVLLILLAMFNPIRCAWCASPARPTPNAARGKTLPVRAAPPDPPPTARCGSSPI